MDPLLLSLRLVHIAAAVFWVGGVMVYLFYVMPVAKSLGAEGNRFVGALNAQARFSPHLTRAGALTTLSGLWLLWIVSGHFNTAWLATRTGTTLVVAALAGTTAFFIGMINNGPAAEALGRLGAEVAAQGTPPSAEQSARLAVLGQRLMTGVYVNLVLLGIAVGGMATFRYVGG